ncbi:MAG: class I SAM-dependent methyltransferase [Actinomycetota bacterium]
MTWDPDAYPAIIRSEIHDYEELQERVAQATAGVSARDILDLGVGAGETAARVLQVHPGARLVGIDSSAAMLRGAARALAGERATLLEQDLGSPLPDQRFDLVVSALAIHHLEGDRKASLFHDIATHLHPGGLFVMGDVIVPEDPSDALIENEPGYDFPSTIDDQVNWMSDAGLSSTAIWVRKDLAVLRAEATIG